MYNVLISRIKYAKYTIGYRVEKLNMRRFSCFLIKDILFKSYKPNGNWQMNLAIGKQLDSNGTWEQNTRCMSARDTNTCTLPRDDDLISLFSLLFLNFAAACLVTRAQAKQFCARFCYCIVCRRLQCTDNRPNWQSFVFATQLGPRNASKLYRIHTPLIFTPWISDSNISSFVCNFLQPTIVLEIYLSTL